MDDIKDKIKSICSIKNEKELYKTIVKMDPRELVEIIYALPKDKVKHACFIVFAFCDFHAKTNKEKSVLFFASLLERKLKSEKKFRRQIISTLNFLLNSDGKPPEKKKDNLDDEDDEEKDSDDVIQEPVS
jgi:hypothetical protein